MADFEIRGGEDVAALVKRINQHGDAKAIKREMFAGINRATKEVRADMKQAPAKVLPGAYGAAVSKDFTARTSAKGGAFAGVTIWTKAKNRDLLRMNRDGRLRHMLFGDRRFWWSQSVPREFLDDAFDASRPEVQRGVVNAMEDIARKIEG